MIALYAISFLAFVVLFLYLWLTSVFVNGWKRMPYFYAKTSQSATKLTVITACKNEREQLPALLDALQKQAHRPFEFILVDDASDDGSWELAVAHSRKFPEMRVIKNAGSGKKWAIKTGISEAQNSLIVSLDADSLPPSTWLSTIAAFYEANPADLIVCPVNMESDGRFFQHFQRFDFVSLVGSGAGAIGAGMPILCNGANLAFRRDAWLESEHELCMEEPSGDDIFLLQSIKKRGGTIRFLKSAAASTVVQPQGDWNSFFRQRRRWAGKRMAYQDKMLFATALVVFLTGAFTAMSLVLSVFDPRFLVLFGAMFGAKWAIDVRFFSRFKSFFGLRNIPATVFQISLIYPFYIVYVAVRSLVGSRKTW